MNKNSPIFIHSLFRSGSTYLFNVFRKCQNDFWCYQEPDHELLDKLNSDPEALLSIDASLSLHLRHQILDKPYFFEIYEIKEHLVDLFKTSFSFDEFFLSDFKNNIQQKKYFEAIIRHAKARPVLQLCRSFGRIEALKSEFKGLHIHLWREPRCQWWSYKVDAYFDASIIKIYKNDNLPTVLNVIKNQLNINNLLSRYDTSEVNLEPYVLSSSNNYCAFYAIWLYSFFKGHDFADINISIDSLSVDNLYKNKLIKEFSNHNIHDLDFSACSMPTIQFCNEEIDTFEIIEHKVESVFSDNGYNLNLLSKAKKVAKDLNGSTDNASLNLDSCKARALALNLLNETNRLALLFDAKDIEYKDTKAQLTKNNLIHLEQAAYINHLNKTLETRDASIASLDSALADQYNYNLHLQKEVSEKDALLTKNNLMHLEQEAYINHLNKTLETRDASIADLTDYINRIKNNFYWRLISAIGALFKSKQQ